MNKSGIRIFSIAAYLLSLILLIYPNVSPHSYNLLFFNSDSIFHEYFYQQVILNHQNIYNWRLPHSFLIFPDFTVFLLLKVFFSNILHLYLASALIMLFILEASTLILVKKVYKFDEDKCLSMVLILSIFNLILPLEPLFYIYAFLITPHQHLGTYFDAVLMLVFYLTTYKPRMNDLKVNIIYALLILIFVFSDTLFVCYFIIPVSILELISALSGLLKHNYMIMVRTLLRIFFIFCISALGVAAYRIIFLISPTYIYVPAILGDSIHFFTDSTTYISERGNLFVIRNYLYVIVPLYIFLFIYIFYKSIIKNGNGINNIFRQADRYFATLFISSFFLFATMNLNPRVFRFMVFAFFMIGIYIMKEIIIKFQPYSKTFPLTLILIFSGVGIYRLANINTFVYTTRQDSVACVEKTIKREQFINGLGSYWISKPMFVITNGRVSLTETEYVTDLKGFRTYITLGEDVPAANNNFDYIVFDYHLRDYDKAVEIFGLPINFYQCGDYNIAAYKNIKVEKFETPN